MKRYLLLLVLIMLSCNSIVPTPNDFPPLPMTVIVENPPTPFLTPTVEARPAVITKEKMQDAYTFQLILMTRLAAGDSGGVAEMVKYPITVNLNGPTVIATANEFEASYDRIFTDDIIEVLSQTNENNLTLLPDGIRVGHGEVWFNLFCVDAACSDTQFFITQINK